MFTYLIVVYIQNFIENFPIFAMFREENHEKSCGSIMKRGYSVNGESSYRVTSSRNIIKLEGPQRVGELGGGQNSAQGRQILMDVPL